MSLQQLINDPLFRQLALAALLGTLLGLERELARKDPSLRTFMLICLGSCAFSIISVYSALGVPNAEPSRIAAQIVVGIGFIGAGSIFRARHKISGLTTAALMWVAASVGMAIGFGREDLAAMVTFIALFSMTLLGVVHRIIRTINPEREDGPAQADGS